VASSKPVNRRTFLGASLSAAGVVLLGGCGSSGGSGGGDDSSDYSGQLSVPLYTQLPDNAVFIVGFSKGIYADHGLKLKPVNFLQGPDVIRSVASKTHLGSSSPISGLVGKEAGLDQIRIIGTCLGMSTIAYMVKPNSPIRSVADLKGKKIGVNAPTSTTTYLATRMVTQAGLDPKKDVELINVKGVSDSATALENGVVDCSWSSPPLSVQLVQEGKMRLLLDMNKVLPGFIQTSLFTDAGFLDSHPDVVQRFIDATSASQAFIRNDVEEASQIYATQLKIDPKIALGTLKALAPGFQIKVPRAGYDANVKACMELGLLKQDTPYDAIVVDKFASAVKAS
jgi:NitT/TauT family transport system substrate-binding protein